jgi:caffeoyl-CoA O-methyltransferase
MQLAPEQAALLTWLVRLIGAREAIEVGTFTGLSSLSIARGLPADGHLLCCDVSEEWTAIAKRHWEMAGVADRIELRIGPGAETLRALPDEPLIDFALIDADKAGYPVYFDEIVRRLRPGGVVCVDNVLWHGGVVDRSDDSETTQVIRAFNDAVAADERVDAVLLPIGDGLTLARRRG